jgi:hypothetical protein
MKPTRREVVQMLGAFSVAQSAAGTPAESPRRTPSAQDLKACLAIQRRELDPLLVESVPQALQRSLGQFQPVRDLDISDAIQPMLIFRPRSR